MGGLLALHVYNYICFISILLMWPSDFYVGYFGIWGNDWFYRSVLMIQMSQLTYF